MLPKLAVENTAGLIGPGKGALHSEKIHKTTVTASVYSRGSEMGGIFAQILARNLVLLSKCLCFEHFPNEKDGGKCPASPENGGKFTPIYPHLGVKDKHCT